MLDRPKVVLPKMVVRNIRVLTEADRKKNATRNSYSAW